MNSDIELSDVSNVETPSYANSATELNGTTKATSALPAVDRGRQAYLFLASATVIEVLVWGLPFSVGVLQEYWSSILFPEGTPNREYIALGATLQTGLLYCSGIIFTPLIAKFPRQRMYLMIFGLVCSVTAIIGAGFATKPIHLVFTLGFIYPFSGLMYFPACNLLFDWFYERRGLASGILFGGTGAGGALFPFIMQGLLQRFGYRVAMIVLAVGYGTAGGIALISIKPRIPISSRGTVSTSRKIDWSFLRRSPFYAFLGAIFFTSLGNFLPSLYLPSFAGDLGLSSSDGVLLLSLMNIASIPGLLLLGYLSDRIPIRYVICFSCIGSAFACLCLWGFAKNIKVLTVFSIVFGVTGLSFASVWTKLITIISADDPALPPLIISLFAFARGIGNISSGPVSNSLLSYESFHGAKGAYGVKNYGPLLLYTGITLIVGSIIGVSFRTPKKREI